MRIDTLNEVAASYWQETVGSISQPLRSIVVLRNTEDKLVGLLPAYKDFPAAFVKVYALEDVDKFDREHRGFLAANQLPRIEGISSARLISVDRDRRAIILHKREYEDTDTAWKRFFIQSLPIDWRAVGCWLRRLHDSSITTTANQDFLARVERQLGARVERLKKVISAGRRDQIARLVADAKVFIRIQPCEWVASHGDFGLANIRLHGSAIEIIDFEYFTSAPREFDILYLLLRLEKSNCFPQRPKVFNSIKSQFLNGYGMNFPPTPVYNLLVTHSLLDILSRYYRAIKANPWKRPDQWISSYLNWHSLKRLNRWLDGIDDQAAAS